MVFNHLTVNGFLHSFMVQIDGYLARMNWKNRGKDEMTQGGVSYIPRIPCLGDPTLEQL